MTVNDLLTHVFLYPNSPDWNTIQNTPDHITSTKEDTKHFCGSISIRLTFISGRSSHFLVSSISSLKYACAFSSMVEASFATHHMTTIGGFSSRLINFFMMALFYDEPASVHSLYLPQTRHPILQQPERPGQASLQQGLHQIVVLFQHFPPILFHDFSRRKRGPVQFIDHFDDGRFFQYVSADGLFQIQTGDSRLCDFPISFHSARKQLPRYANT